MARKRRLKDDWTTEARNQWNEILRFYIERNGSQAYSRRLKKKMDEVTRAICIDPEWGQQSAVPNVRWRLVEYFIVYYTVESDRILVLSVWDARRDPDGFPYLLEEINHVNDGID